ncbi:Superfamilies 1 and 2 helicase C-terminal domain protein [Acididesulfobacillus acetoxydans]|uniref:RNA polymerase-associated protein RapA n=1 Tax=Acididesulfobacillus acetoxydans TaxID=1561005 RepID=A0A8S0X558_9FIRM|nr:SNF2-related protein [Acididesulfobacillus acetoxydans]CAA7601380.1 Superfamilies 1 and 2 helicase C-terminal domain protein [Acididesulfobacillus acetoxydans]CEJ07459.1 RNA polymerase-associated protein RapA [Acididesulfobacillus acetoxydans]
MAPGKPVQDPENAAMDFTAESWSFTPIMSSSEMSAGMSGKASSVKIFFFPREASLLLDEIEAGRFSPADDLYLRWQALELAVHPSFETLMALNAVRDVQSLDYQLQTVRHVLMRLRGRALLCDEVGMGKTVEAGLITLEYILRGLVQRVLVLTPPSLVEQWQEEMQHKFNLDFAVYDSPEFRANDNPWREFPRIIASIDTVKRAARQEQVLALNYDLVIIDEAHHLKNQRSQAYRLVSRLKKKYILLLTATPVENDLEELFNLITLLSPGQLETAASFKHKYITRGDPLKPKNAETLKQLIREVMVRNRRSETGAIVGGRSADIVRIELSPDEMAFYRRLTGFVRGYYQREGDKAQAGSRAGISAFVLKVLQREAGSSIEAVLPTLEKMAVSPDYPDDLRRPLAGLARQAEAIPRRAKVEAVLRLLPKIQDKVIIFTGFSATQRYLAKTLRHAGWKVAELHSGLRRQEKEEQVRFFAEEADGLVSTETGSEGRNLQFCHQMINYDLPWNPMRIEQRIGRIHRFGQEKNVRIYNLSATDKIEAHLLELLDAKINMFQLVVGELDMILGDLTEKRDFEDLLMDIWARSSDDARLNAEMTELGERLASAKEHYQAVKELDERLLGELAPDESDS